MGKRQRWKPTSTIAAAALYAAFWLASWAPGGAPLAGPSPPHLAGGPVFTPESEAGWRQRYPTTLLVRLIDADGTPLANRPVAYRLQSAASSPSSPRWTPAERMNAGGDTDADGRLVVEAGWLTPERASWYGPYRLELRLTDEAGDVWRGRVVVPRHQQPGALDLGDVALERRSPFFTGRILDERGEPAAGVPVFFDDCWPYPTWWWEDDVELVHWGPLIAGFADAEGRFEFHEEDLPHGVRGVAPERVRVESPGHAPIATPPIRGSERTLELGLVPGGSLSVRIDAPSELLERLPASARLVSSGAPTPRRIERVGSQVLDFPSHHLGEHRLSLIFGAVQREVARVRIPAPGEAVPHAEVHLDFGHGLAARRLQLVSDYGQAGSWSEIRELPDGPVHTHFPAIAGSDEPVLLLPADDVELEVRSENFAPARVRLGPFDSSRSGPCAQVELRPRIEAEFALFPPPDVPAGLWLVVLLVPEDEPVRSHLAVPLDRAGRGRSGALVAGRYRPLLRVEAPYRLSDEMRAALPPDVLAELLSPAAGRAMALGKDLSEKYWAQSMRFDLGPEEAQRLTLPVDAAQVEAAVRAWSKALPEGWRP